jgi:hypothetical protein
MKRARLFSFPLLFLVLFCYNCSNDGTSSRNPHQYGDFFVRYLAQARQLKATANFLEGDTIRTAQPIEMERGVLFQGKSMEMRYLPNDMVRYSTEEVTEYPDKFSFSFGKSQVFEMDMTPIDSFTIKEGKCQLSDGLSFYVDAPPGDKESLVLFFSDANRKATTLTLEGPIASQQITVPADQLSQLTPGPYELYLVKKKKISKEEKAVSSLGAIEYYTPAINFTAY